MLGFKHSNTTCVDLGFQGIHWYPGRTGTQTPAINTTCDLRHLYQMACAHMTYAHLPVFSSSSLLHCLQNLIQWKLRVIRYYTRCLGLDTFNRNTVF